MPYLLLFKTMTKLYEAESILRREGIRFDMVPVPEEILDDMCGEMALKVWDREALKMFDEIKVVDVEE